VLTPDMPYELLTYALKEAAFPRQSTGDQFFDHEQFDAYRASGSTSAPPPSRRARARCRSGSGLRVAGNRMAGVRALGSRGVLGAVGRVRGRRVPCG